MKHVSRFAALMTAAVIFAFLPGAQVCGQARRGGGGHSSGGGSHSSSISHSSSGSHSGGSTYSHGGSHSSGRSGGSISSSHSRPSGSASSHHSGSSMSQSRPSGGHSGVSQSRPSGGNHGTMSRPSGGSSASRPSGQVSRPGGPGSHPSGGSSAGARRQGGYHDNSYGHSRPSGDISRGAAVPNSGNHHADARPSGGNHHSEARPGGHGAPARGHVDGAHRPAPGSRPYADGAYGGRRPHGTPSRVSVNHRPGAPAAHRPPVHREYRGRPAHFHVRGHHHYGHFIPGPPPSYKLYHYWGRDYYYYDSIWYRYYGGRYWICRPPWGYVFSPLADAVFTACEFAYYFDRIHYYNTVSENAQTIAAQNEAIAANNAVLASQNEAIARGAAAANAAGDLAASLGLVQSYANANTEYFYNDGVFYIKGADGQYTVIVPPAGALVETLPEDYEIVTLGGKEYYKVDDTIYRMVVIDNKAMFEVLGQMVS